MQDVSRSRDEALARGTMTQEPSFVCTTYYSNQQAELLRNYVATKEDHIRCTIVQAARATSAAPLFFDSIEIDGIRFSDGGLRNNNPISVVRTELRAEFPGRPVGCIISIGTGVHQTQKLGKTLVAIAKSCADIATNIERAHQDFKANECGAQGPFRDKYFRFNVDQGLQDIQLHEWKRMNDVTSRTRHYLRINEHEIDTCVNCLVRCDQVAHGETIIEEK